MIHEIFIQLVINYKSKFTKQQQEKASRVFAFKFCWDTIKKEYKKEAGAILKKLADLGWNEYLEKWKEVNKND